MGATRRCHPKRKAVPRGIGARVCDPQQRCQLEGLRMARAVLDFHVAATHRVARRQSNRV
jgi:hypothetical protein